MFDVFGILNLTNMGYLGPGTGSLIIQSLIGVVAGVTVFGRNAISRVTGKTKQLLNRSAKPETKTE